MFADRLDQIIFDQLQTLCRELNRSEVYESLLESLTQTTISADITLYDELLEHFTNGNESDIQQFIRSRLSLPLGIRLKLTTILQQASKAIQITLSDPLILQSESHQQGEPRSVLADHWEDWKSGIISSAMYFSKLTDSVAKGLINSDQFIAASNRALMEGGHLQYNSSNINPDNSQRYSMFMPRQQSFYCNMGEIASIQYLLPRKQGVLDLYSLDAYYARVTTNCFLQEASESDPVHSRFISAVPCQSTSTFWWEHVGDLEHMQVGMLTCNEMSFDPHHLHSQDKHLTSSALLMIGDFLQLSKGSLEVDKIVAVDAHLLDLTSASFCTVMVIKGRWSGSSVGHDDTLTQDISEGRSELAPQDDINQSPNTSGQDDIPNIVPDFSYISQYYLVIAICSLQSSAVEHCIALEDYMEQDQVPIAMKLSNDVAFVYGLHGLLLQVNINRMESSSSIINYKPTILNLVQDTMLIRDFHPDMQLVTSHTAETAIIDISYQQNCHRLVSLDESGVVCLWDVTDATNTTTVLLGTPFQLPSQHRANHVFLAPSGEQVVVAMNDRLLLLHLNQEVLENAIFRQVSTNSVYNKALFYDRCSLDLLPEKQCKYAVHFDYDAIRIWRLMNATNQNQVETGMTITTWIHPNVDGFSLRKLASCSSSSVYNGSDSTHLLYPDAEQYPSINGSLSASSESWPSFFQRPAIKPRNSLTDNKELSSEMDQDANFQKHGASTGDDVMIITDASTPLGQSADVRQQQFFPSMMQSSPFTSSFVIYGDEVIPIYQETVCFDFPSPGSIMPSNDNAITSASTDVMINSMTMSSSGDSIAFTTSNPSLVLQSVQHHSEDEQFDLGITAEAPYASLLSPTLFRQAIQSHHSSAYYQCYGMFRPARKSLYHVSDIDNHLKYLHRMFAVYSNDRVESFQDVKLLLSLLTACMTSPNSSLLCAALDCSLLQLESWLRGSLSSIVILAQPVSLSTTTSTTSSGANTTSPTAVTPSSETGHHFDHRASAGNGLGTTLLLTEGSKQLLRWLCSTDLHRIGKDFWIDISLGHNLLCALYLKHCGNKSVAVEQSWQQYLQTYGPIHLRRSSRGLRLLTTTIRKIDETANIKSYLPYQIGYISGLQEIYARRVGLSGTIPKEIGQLSQLRVLSMGNNRLTGQLPSGLTNLRHLQRIVLHQNNLIGNVPDALSDLGCIVNLAGNPRLNYGPDVSPQERNALIDFFFATKGPYWNTKTYWITSKPVCKWYKVGVLSSHVHSLVMSSNNMEGTLPPSIGALKHLRMIELATMTGLTGPIPKELCSLRTLRRLCICRCGLTGNIPEEIGQLVGLEELQLFGNRLTGSIPNSVGNLINLKLLSLGEYTGGNHFNAEPIPHCISKLAKLEALFLANCNLKGSLPTWIGDLAELRQLDLQRNQLTGSLPRAIGKLQNLLYLNIKDNSQLGGRLPLNELISLHKLNRLSLVHCNFADSEVALEALKLALPRCKIWL